MERSLLSSTFAFVTPMSEEWSARAFGGRGRAASLPSPSHQQLFVLSCRAIPIHLLVVSHSSRPFQVISVRSSSPKPSQVNLSTCWAFSRF
ncbi:hypothetical protein L596_027905 [Steinernema carpocapsae]|uniref:Uncharacterized protein n=1 Tax=Steinernema carpocapsae TaxID=34508 RepID=A0A4U5LWY1_STECR|nr:hypothetical protein L596_027905 [Steinernema carpocapsae]